MVAHENTKGEDIVNLNVGGECFASVSRKVLTQVNGLAS